MGAQVHPLNVFWGQVIPRVSVTPASKGVRGQREAPSPQTLIFHAVCTFQSCDLPGPLGRRARSVRLPRGLSLEKAWVWLGWEWAGWGACGRT